MNSWIYEFKDAVYYLSRIRTSPNAIPNLKGKQRRYITHTGRVNRGEFG